VEAVVRDLWQQGLAVKNLTPLKPSVIARGACCCLVCRAILVEAYSDSEHTRGYQGDSQAR